MNKSPLVPVTVTDKNGVVTTRHKKVAPTPVSERSIPAPTSVTRVSPEKAASLLTSFKLLSKGSSTYQSLYRVITTETSVSEYDAAVALLSVPVNHPDESASGRRWMVQKIFEQSGDKAWRLDVATGLAHETSLHSRWYLPFIQTMVDEEGYGRIVRGYSKVSLEDQKKLCAVANALTEIDQQYDENAPATSTVERKFLRTNARGAMIVYDRPLFKALVEHPEKAAQIAKLYVQRWSLDALDEVLDAPSAISEGAL
jgi:hypothetical protein